MKHVLADNGVLNMGGGVAFQIPLWYDDLAKTGLVPRWVYLGVCALATTDDSSQSILICCCLGVLPSASGE